MVKTPSYETVIDPIDADEVLSIFNEHHPNMNGCLADDVTVLIDFLVTYALDWITGATRDEDGSTMAGRN